MTIYPALDYRPAYIEAKHLHTRDLLDTLEGVLVVSCTSCGPSPEHEGAGRIMRAGGVFLVDGEEPAFVGAPGYRVANLTFRADDLVRVLMPVL